MKRWFIPKGKSRLGRMESVKQAVLCALLLIVGVVGQAQSVTPDVQFSLRYYNKEIYTNDPDQAILLQVGLRNQGTSPVWFSLPSQPVFQLALTVLPAGRTGLALPPADKFNENRFNNQPVFFRDVSILPGEEFNYTINLRDFVAINDPGVYTVSGMFYPSLLPEFQGARGQTLRTSGTESRSSPTGTWASMADTPVGAVDDTVLKSNVLTLTVRPTLPAGSASTLRENLDQATQDYLKREALAPDAVVTYLLLARQNQEEAKFFLYLNAEALYKRAPQFRRTYLASSEEQRQRTLTEFQDELWRREETLAKVPSAFEILTTNYSAREATVTARLKFDAGDYLETREYKYALQKNAGFWEIYDYQVRNLGTERKGRQ